MNHRAALLAAIQLTRFCGVGLVCLVASTAILAALHDFVGLHYLVAFVVSFCLANVLGYALNGRFTFRFDSLAQAFSATFCSMVSCWASTPYS